MIELAPMNNTVSCDPNVPDDIRRQQPYDGQLFVYAARPSVLALANFAFDDRKMRLAGSIQERRKGAPSPLETDNPEFMVNLWQIVRVVELDN
jgi:hypothetical protein